MALAPPLTDTSDDAIVRAIVEHDTFLVTTLVRLAGIELHEEPDASWYVSGVDDPLFNGVLRTSMAAADAERRIDELLGRFREAGVPALWWATPQSTPADLPSRLAARGIERTSMPGLALDLARLPDAPVPEGLRIEQVADAAGIDAYLTAGGDAFDIPVAHRERFRGTPEAVMAGDIPGWCLVGWVDDAPVATAVICVATGVAGLSNIATVPAHRRRGIGAAVTAHGLRLARDRGYRTAVCTSTASGAPLYEALGFVERCRVDDFEFRPSS